MSQSKLTGIEKAAILLNTLQPEVVEKVLQHMGLSQADRLRADLVKIKERADLKEVVSVVLDEVATIMTASRANPDVSSNPIAGAPTQASDGSSATKVADEPEPKNAAPRVDIRLAELDAEPDPDEDPLVSIAKLPPDLLAQALENESTRVTSLLMTYLDVEIAGQVYKRLTPAKRKEVSMRFTEQATVDQELLRRIARALLQKCQKLLATSVAGAAEPGAREKRIATLLRGLERTERIEMIGVLEQTDAELAGRIKSMLYQFEDILRMQNVSVQKLLTQVDTKSLAQALSGAPPELSEKLLSNLSKRAQESLKEEMDLTGKVPIAKARQAQQSIADAIQGLDQRGELMLSD